MASKREASKQVKYQIRSITFQPEGAINLTREAFNEIVTAKRSLVIARGIEEKFNLVIENYFEFERELLELALHHTVFNAIDWSIFQNDIFTVNRRLANLLTAGRAYEEQIEHDLKRIDDNNPQVVDTVRLERKSQYDKVFGFRFVEALRNYTQHRDFPVHSLSYDRQRDEGKEKVFVRNTAIPSVSLNELRSDSIFKRRILKELEGQDDLIPLTPLVREYIEALGRIHDALRNGIADDLERFDGIVASAVDRAQNELGAKFIAAVMIAEDGVVIEEDQLFVDLIERRKNLERRNRYAGNLASQYVTSMAE